MGVATATAIGLGISAASAGASFAQAGKQNRLRREAESAADKAMQEARKALEVNFYESLSIQKEPYELQREALKSAGAQAIQAGVESERGAAATVGRVAMAQNEAQAGIRTEMGKELTDLEKMTAQEESRLRDVGVQLSLAETEGAQQAAADAQRASAAATSQGLQSITSAGQQIIANADLYGKTKDDNKVDYSNQGAVSNKPPTATQLADANRIPLTGKLSDMRFPNGIDFRAAANDYQNQTDFFNYLNNPFIKR
jgi:hypothetical protein